MRCPGRRNSHIVQGLKGRNAKSEMTLMGEGALMISPTVSAIVAKSRRVDLDDAKERAGLQESMDNPQTHQHCSTLAVPPCRLINSSLSNPTTQDGNGNQMEESYDEEDPSETSD
ncbi:hypothetical protein VNO77_50841 [Canavalia gladiata]|uniref:Uncharacterized protein n=1 Tax=Canavalia gladiata TaxID=3824 RepID=A0AAN9PEV5_CANGL